MHNKIYPSLWFDNQALEAMAFYVSAFPESQLLESNPVVASASIAGVRFIGINGGPVFKPNPSISFMYTSESREEIDLVWEQLTEGGMVLMPLGTHPWSEHYGWISDKYGVSWQLYLGKLSDVNHQRIAPTLMYCGEQQGKCAEALDFYGKIFPNFKLEGILTYPGGFAKDQVQHAQFLVNDFTMMAMDSGVAQPFSFEEGVSLVLECADQAEIDYYWHAFTQNGSESMCGWCKDPYGVSWQVIPHNLSRLLHEYPHASQTLMNMKKIIIDELKK